MIDRPRNNDSQSADAPDWCVGRPGSGRAWSFDTEFGWAPDKQGWESAWRPIVACFEDVDTGERVHFWGRDRALGEWLHEHRDDLFNVHYAVAEMTYLLRLGIELPQYWFDTFVAWRAITNRPKCPRAGLGDVLGYLGQPGAAHPTKKAMQKKLGTLAFDPNSEVDLAEAVEYCYSDCAASTVLLRQLWDRIPKHLMPHWMEFMKAASKIELRGIPMDVRTVNSIGENRESIKQHFLGIINRNYEILRPSGHVNMVEWLRWCVDHRVAWPYKTSPKTGRLYYAQDSDTFDDMSVRHPFIEKVYQTKKTIQQLNNRKMIIDQKDGRHYFGVSAFRSVSGRNQPSGYIFAAPKWMRHLIRPGNPDEVLVDYDFVAQEVCIAADHSGDENMKEMYRADDCHMEFAIRAGAAPKDATKATHREIRKQYKTVNLGVLFGQSAYGVSKRLGIPVKRAETIIADHKHLFPDFWCWSERVVETAFANGYMTTPLGWRAKVHKMSNERTWRNYPMQATGADIMRLALIYLEQQNVKVLCPIHDGFLMPCHRDQVDDLNRAVDHAFHLAVDTVLPESEMKWSQKVHEGRFHDDDGVELWAEIRRILKEVDAGTTWPKSATCTAEYY
jgi:DNA polymerase I-like protein with 3'-5' exonuclease and polymerase domains